MEDYERRAYETDLAFVERQLARSEMPPEMTDLFRARAESHRAVLGLMATANVVELPTAAVPETLAA
ncbi:MAG TPA: hypothetical protein VHC21_01570 [Candidatus Saccharimonadales bacterium]|nr:hypothetical protein [Candidatus Saccharimonadales bacterium]